MPRENVIASVCGARRFCARSIVGDGEGRSGGRSAWRKMDGTMERWMQKIFRCEMCDRGCNSQSIYLRNRYSRPRLLVDQHGPKAMRRTAIAQPFGEQLSTLAPVHGTVALKIYRYPHHFTLPLLSLIHHRSIHSCDHVAHLLISDVHAKRGVVLPAS